MYNGNHTRTLSGRITPAGRLVSGPEDLTPSHKATVRNVKDPPTPAQFSKRTQTTSAERAMWAACLYQGIESAVKHGNTDQGRLDFGWIVSNAWHPGSFEWICGALDLDFDRIRGEVVRKTNDGNR